MNYSRYTQLERQLRYILRLHTINTSSNRSVSHVISNESSKCLLPRTLLHSNFLMTNRSKSKSAITQKDKQKSESEEDKSSDDYTDDKTSQVMNIKVQSLRLDGILKSGLGIARNKIDLIFYESKIRLNGEKVLKKSIGIDEGDEIDIIKGVSGKNSQLLTIARIEILKAATVDDYINLKIRRCKSLIIDNYNEKWKPTASDSS